MSQGFSSLSPCKSVTEGRRKYSLKHRSQKPTSLSLQRSLAPSFKPLSRMSSDPIQFSLNNIQVIQEPHKIKIISIAKDNGLAQKRRQISNVKSATSLNIIDEQKSGNSQHYKRAGPYQFKNVKNINEPVSLQNLTETVDSFNCNSRPRPTSTINLSLKKQKTIKTQTYLRPPEVKLQKTGAVSQEYQRTNKDNKDKVSLRRNQPILRGVKSEVYVCLKYADLRIAAKPAQENMVTQIKEKYAEITNIRKSMIVKKMCNQNLKGKDKGGCRCDPKCYWVNKWLDMARLKPSKIIRPLINGQYFNNLNKAIQQIQKDITRTYPTHPTFQNQQYIFALREILISYCKVDFQASYFQGMNMVAGIIVYHSSSIQDGLAIFDLIMRGHELRRLYINDLVFVQTLAKKLFVQLRWLAYDIYNYLNEQSIELSMFVTSWYFSLMGTFVPLTEMHLIIDTFLRKGFTGLNQIILTLLIYLRSELLIRLQDELMEFFSTQSMMKYAVTIDWVQLVRTSQCLQVRNLQL